jgi:transcription initiation factor TFIIIB Brf1 subunit/transcription initiation factor TFIIB
MTSIDEAWAAFDASRATREPEEQPIEQEGNYYICTCGGTKVYGPDNLPVCTSCGKVDTVYVSDTPEWVSAISEDGVKSDTARCGMPNDTDLFSESWGTGTVINAKWGNYSHQKMARINFHSSMNHRDRSLFHAYADIEKAARDNMGLPPNIIKSAKILYRKFNSDVLTRGAVRTGIKANCVFYACKLASFPRTTKEIADAFGIQTRDISRTADTFKNTLVGESTAPEVTRPHHVIPRLLNEFNITQGTTRMKCVKTARLMEDCVPLMGKTPNSIAAAVIFWVLDGTVTKQDIVTKCGVSMPTLNKIQILVNKHLEAKCGS